MQIRQDAIDAIIAHARRESPRECCGLLLGTDRGVREAIAVTNVADEPHRHFRVSPADHFALVRRCRETTSLGSGAVEIIGVYHSHPRSAPVPSPTDHQEATEDFLYIIAGPIDGSTTLELRAYRLIEGEFQDVELTGDPASGRPERS